MSIEKSILQAELQAEMRHREVYANMLAAREFEGYPPDPDGQTAIQFRTHNNRVEALEAQIAELY